MDPKNYVADLTKFASINYETYLSQIAISEAVQAGLAPFRPRGEMTVFMDFDIDFMKERLVIEFPETGLYFKLGIEYGLFVKSDPRVVYDIIGEQLFNVIRYREILPIPSNIELGEN